MASILVVDDEERMRDLLCIILERRGHSVDQAGDGIEALALAENRDYDLMITDIKMPRMDGMDLLQRVRQKTSMPVIFLTSKDEEIDEQPPPEPVEMTPEERAAWEEEQQRRQGNQQQGQGQDPMEGDQEENLLPTSAELKMLKSLQVRVNRRTEQFDRMAEAMQVGEAAARSMTRQLQALSLSRDEYAAHRALVAMRRSAPPRIDGTKVDIETRLAPAVIEARLRDQAGQIFDAAQL